MRAVQIKTFGEPGIVPELADLPEPPAPAAGQVLIGVEHAPINMNDLYLIQGVYPVRPSLPSVVGNEGVGRVLAIGSDIADDAVTRAGAVGLAIAATAVGGMFFCVLRRRSDSTLAPIVAHTSMNSLGVFASAIAP